MRLGAQAPHTRSSHLLGPRCRSPLKRSWRRRTITSREAVRSFATTNNISTVRCDNGERHIARDLSIELRADGLPIPDGRWHLGHGNR